MKKKVLVSAVLAVMLVAALAVTAGAAQVATVSWSNANPDTGDTVTITVTPAAGLQGLSGTVSVSGLEIVSVANNPLGSNNQIVLVDTSGSGLASPVFTCRVTGAAGSTASFAFTPSEVVGADGSQEAGGTVGGTTSAPIGGSTPTTAPPTQTPPPTNPPTQTPSDEPSGSPSGSASVQPTGSGSVNPTASGSATHPTASQKPGQDKMPKTGDTTMDMWTLVIIAAACGAVAIVAGKKVLSR